MYFCLFFGIVSADANMLFAVRYTLLEGGGKLVFDEGEDNPLSLFLKVPAVRVQPASSNLTFRKRKCRQGRDLAIRAV